VKLDRLPAFVALASAAALLAGCPPTPYDIALKNAKDAQQRGDVAMAALEYHKACQLKPKETETCNQAKATFAQLKQQKMPIAQPACDAGDVDACVGALTPITAVHADDPDADRLWGQGFAVYMARCKTFDKATSLDAGVATLKCLHHGVDVAKRQSPDVATTRALVAKRFYDSASGKPAGATYAMLKTAACLQRSMYSAGDAVASDALIAAAATPIVVRVQSVGQMPLLPESVELCGAIARELGPRAQCGIQGDAPLAWNVRASLGTTRHTVADEMRVARYVAGTETITNPERAPAQRDMERAQQAFNDIERDKLAREAKCNSNRQDKAACDNYNAVVPVYNRRLEELNHAKDKLSRTPPTLQRDIVKEVPYTVKHHVWQTPWSFEGEPAGRDQGVFEQRDSESPGVAPANVPPDPLVVPTREQIDAELRRRLVAAGKARFEPEFAARVATCAGLPWVFDDPKTDCRVIAEFLRGSQPPSPTLWLPGIPCDK
jgi:hypothetical protein